MFLGVTISTLISVRILRYFALTLLFATVATSNCAWAQSSVSGVNTMSTTLPIGADGKVVMTVYDDGTDGYVGIGTTAPVTTLDVNGGNGSGIAVRQTGAVSSSFPAIGMYMGMYGNGTYGFIQASGSGTTNDYLSLNPNGGNVGIGITSPSAQLQLWNATRGGDFGLGQQNDSQPYMRLGMDTSWIQYVANNAYWTGTAYNYVNTGGYGGVATRMAQQSGNLWFDTASGATNPISWNTRMFIANDGNVGIGMTPTATLDVNGGIRGNNSGTVAGSGCSPEGMLAYDMTNHQPIYCSNGGVWAAVNTDSAYMNRTWHAFGAFSGTNSFSYPIEIDYWARGSVNLTLNVNGTTLSECQNTYGYQDVCQLDVTVPPGESWSIGGCCSGATSMAGPYELY